MNVFDYRPPNPAFREYVRQYQIVGFSFPASDVMPIKPYWPRPENCLAFYPRGGDWIGQPTGVAERWMTRSALVGQHVYLTHRHPLHDFVLFQVVFQPGALFRLTGVPSGELTNAFLDAEAVFSTEISRVNERLSGTDDHLEMIAIVEDFLHGLIRRSTPRRPIDRVGEFLLAHPTKFSLDWLADQACLSPRQFYNQFVQRMGVSPKLFARIARFDQSVKIKNARPATDGLTLALEAGYYDYQHLVRDYREFTRMLPGEFSRLESNAPERRFGKVEI
jgi:AraC-like DNA-binding protein